MKLKSPTGAQASRSAKTILANKNPARPISRRSLLRYVHWLMLSICLSACSRVSEQAGQQQSSDRVITGSAEEKTASVAANPGMENEKQRDALMKAIYQDAYRAGGGNALAPIAGSEGETDKYLLTFVSAIDLPDGRTMVAVNGMPSDEEGNEQFGHASAGLLNVYVLQRVAGQWKVTKRLENIDALGSNGRIGSVTWITLAPGKTGIVVSSGGTWQGYTISVAQVYELGDEARSLGSFNEHSDNTGACTEQTDECWEVGGTWRFVDNGQPETYRDIVVEFTGKTYTVTAGKDGSNTEHAKSDIKESARYRFDGKQYRLISGANPVPDV